MKKFVNDPADVVPDALRGFAAAHPELRVDHANRVLFRADAPVPGKVGIVSGGGSGHEPLHGGFVGPGMLDAETLRVGGEVAVLAHRQIDALIREAHERAAGLLAVHRPLLETLAAALLDEETLDGGRIREIGQRFDAIPAPRPPHPLMPAPRHEVPQTA